ncbi:16S rRNA (cytosine(1402)-N(4))-methyltransferase RsmH [Candidatus Protochlamydia phocaeensis]|uniref:16S rRNA (cytosine(1402)-N(4))-methyltransferase RsmH n=1 Tax=Candidatus Protochlamydia phocaeensis TaxID=1414722 RepID=UPI0008391915|nr:16S rRNA (cytosine(1402)-N(4))-methyltransferase RsmH [Candidatus Protochlamydia phocaeensis]
MNTSVPHRSVLLDEVLQAFEATALTVFVDGTLGAGGHAEALLRRHPEIKCYLGIDQDPQALALAGARLEPWKDKIQLRQGNFSQFDQFLKELGLANMQGILVDLGVSSMQLDQAERGFSFSREGPLDMRMNPQGPLTAADIVNTWSEQELGRIFREYGEEKKWRAAAHAIVQARKIKPFQTTVDLAVALRPVLPWNPKKGINPLTLIFQALRICVNGELDVLEQLLPKAIEYLSPKGRLAVISFHSLEDRLVKTQMRLAASDKWDTVGLGSGLFRDKEPTVSLITKKPVVPTEEEVAGNPRSRSAKLRVIEKI